MGAASEFYGIWKFAKNKEAANEFLRHYSANWPEAFKASEGYNNPCFAGLVPKPMPILSNDPTSTPHDKLAILQDSDKWSAIPGYPGPATPAMDEIYYQFIIPDMMAKAATGAVERRRRRSSGPRVSAKPSSRSGPARPDRLIPGPRVRARSGPRRRCGTPA